MHPETHEFTPGSVILSMRYLLHHRLGADLFPRKAAHVLPASDCPDLEPAARALIHQLHPWRSTESLLIGRERIPLAENFAIEAAFYAWLARVIALLLDAGESLQIPGEDDARITRAVEEILTHPMRTPFSEKALAQKCGLAVSHLNRLYKQTRGITPFQEYDQHRLQLARHALSETALPAKEIAYELGFNTPAHFSNWFRSKENRSPRSFRQVSDGRKTGS
jgi:AraC-like DNA-binding protein